MHRFGLVLVATAFSLVLAMGVARFLDARSGLQPTALPAGADLMLLGLAGMGACWWLSRRAQARREKEISAGLPFTGQRFEARARWLGRLVLLFVSIAVSALLIFALVRQPSWGLAGLAIFSVLVAVLIAALLYSMRRAGRPTLVMDGVGIEHALVGQIPWGEVHGITLVRTMGKNEVVHSLALGVEGADRFNARLPAVARWISRTFAPAHRVRDVVHLPLDGLDKSPREVHAAALALRGRISPETIPGWHPHMSRSDFEIAEELRRLNDPDSGLSPEEARQRLMALEPKVKASLERARRENREGILKAWAIIAASVLVILGVLAHVLWKTL